MMQYSTEDIVIFDEKFLQFLNFSNKKTRSESKQFGLMEGILIQFSKRKINSAKNSPVHCTLEPRELDTLAIKISNMYPKIRSGTIKNLETDDFKSKQVYLLFPLQKTENYNSSDFSSHSLRKQLRKIEKINFNIEFRDNFDTGWYKEIYLPEMQRKGSPPQTKKFFESMNRCFGNSFKQLLIYFEDELLGGAIILEARNSIAIYLSLVTKKGRMLQANSAIFLEVINLGVEKQKKFIDFGRSARYSGAHRYKSQWSPDTLSVKSYKYIKKPSAKFMPSAPKETAPIYKVCANLIRKIPIRSNHYGFLFSKARRFL